MGCRCGGIPCACAGGAAVAGGWRGERGAGAHVIGDGRGVGSLSRWGVGPVLAGQDGAFVEAPDPESADGRACASGFWCPAAVMAGGGGGGGWGGGGGGG